jgi:glycosyltransferase involved in cell wall biosynthesis
MKILTVHNYYKFGGGEDEVFRREKQLLISKGHEVVEYTRHNDEITRCGLLKAASLAGRTVWAFDSHRDISKLLEKERPHVAHFHNTFPLISPSAYYACAAAGVPVVQTLHNSRLVCPAGTLYRDGRPCDDCAGRTFAWPAIQYGCYQESRVRSAVAASMAAAHRGLGTWELKVDRYVVFSDFYRKLFIGAGVAPEKIALKPHFVDCDPGVRKSRGEYALFIGRLVPEKGIRTLLTAWHGLQDIPLKIRGEGPLGETVNASVEATDSRITLVPRPEREELFELIKGARFLVWPSEGYNETFGLVAIEAFACGVPVLASRIGVAREIVRDGYTGLHFRPGDPSDLAEKAAWAWRHPNELQRMGEMARAEFEAKYTKERNYTVLMDIYERVVRELESSQSILAPAVTESSFGID